MANALLHNGGGKGFRALVYLLPQQDVDFFVAYNLADRHDEGEAAGTVHHGISEVFCSL